MAVHRGKAADSTAEEAARRSRTTGRRRMGRDEEEKVTYTFRFAYMTHHSQLHDSAAQPTKQVEEALAARLRHPMRLQGTRPLRHHSRRRGARCRCRFVAHAGLTTSQNFIIITMIIIIIKREMNTRRIKEKYCRRKKKRKKADIALTLTLIRE